jgi:hypothetical protein
MYVPVSCVYPAMSKSPKQLLNCLKRAEAIVILIVFNVKSMLILLPFFTVTLQESGTRNALLRP